MPDQHEEEDDDAPLNPEHEERIAIGKALNMAKRLYPGHPDRVALEEFLRRKHWSKR